MYTHDPRPAPDEEPESPAEKPFKTEDDQPPVLPEPSDDKPRHDKK